jgi:hypothetical protein
MGAKAYVVDNDPDSQVALVNELVKDITARSQAGGGTVEEIIAYSIVATVAAVAARGASFDQASSSVRDFLAVHKAILTGAMPQARRVGFVH